MKDFTWTTVHESFQELFYTAKTGIDCPQVRTNNANNNKGRSFLIIEPYELDHDDGYWVVDDSTGVEGFLSSTSDVF